MSICNCCRSDHQTDSSCPPVVVSRSDAGKSGAATRRGSRSWPSQLNVVDIHREQTGKNWSIARSV